VEIRRLFEIVELAQGNGFAVAISPKPGLTGESEGAANRTVFAKVLQRSEAASRELRSRNGSLATGGHYGGAKGCCEVRSPAEKFSVDLRSIDPSASKRAGGELRGNRRSFRLQQSESCMPASGWAELSVHSNRGF